MPAGLVSVLLSVCLYGYFFMRNSLAPLMETGSAETSAEVRVATIPMLPHLRAK